MPYSEHMRIFAIGDTHLSRGRPKPMDIFGPHWHHHDERIRDNWNREASDDDLLLIAGDVSWASRPEEVVPDLAFLAGFRGRKLLLKGNHDHWWGSLSRIQKLAPAGIDFLQNDARLDDGVAIAGARGWTLPCAAGSENDQRLFERELQRLQLSLAAARRLESQTLIVMTHFPPLRLLEAGTEVTQLIEQAGAIVCVYGHLHGDDIRSAARGVRNGVDYQLVSADAVDFCPRQIWPPLVQATGL
jgi:uncharacterized protein